MPWTPEHLAAIRAANSRPRSEEHRRKLAQANIGKHTGLAQTPEAEAERVRKIIAAQKGRAPRYGRKRFDYEARDGRKFVMRSSWEVAYAKHCDERMLKWEYESRMFDIGKGEWLGTTYTPDFYMPQFNLYVEIKGFLSPTNKLKMDRFKECWPGVPWVMLGAKDLALISVVVPQRNELVGEKKYNSGLEAMWAARKYHPAWGSWSKGVKRSAEWTEKQRQSHLGQPAWNKGVPMRESSKQKLSTAKMGRPAWNKGIPTDPEVLKKLSAIRKGRILTEEHKQKVADGLRRAYAEGRRAAKA